MLARLFDRAFGRGLYLAREIVEAHGGALRVRSEHGRGCEVTLVLPVAGGPADAERATP